MFTVIEITKNSRNLVTKHLMVINSFLDEEAIDDLVMDWCTNDPSGQANGWSSNWEVVTDKHKIILAVDTELRSLEKRIDSMTSRVYQLKDFQISNMVDDRE